MRKHSPHILPETSWTDACAWTGAHAWTSVHAWTAACACSPYTMPLSHLLCMHAESIIPQAGIVGDMRISYAKFLQLLEADRVKRVVVYGDMKTAVVEGSTAGRPLEAGLVKGTARKGIV
eukprot:1157246-Pelagomonas_calceolata.AAC.7